MKITIITSPFSYIPPDGIGAVERIWFQLSKEFQKSGHKVNLISKQKKGALENNNNVIYIKGYGRTGKTITDIFLDFSYSIRALMKMKKTDILILNTFWTPLLIKFFKSKYKKAIYNVARVPKGQLKFYKDIDRFSCVSNAVGIVTLKSVNDKNRVKVIHNPINSKVFSFTEPTNNNQFKILYFGRIAKEKGLNILIEAVNLLHKQDCSIQLEFLGPYETKDGGSGTEYKNKLDSLSLIPINWIDPVSNPTILKSYLDECSVFCYPSIAEKGETFGVAPLEAMASGRATIVSSLSCFEDFVNANENALVFDHRTTNPEVELSKSIMLLYNDVEKRNDIARKGAVTALDFTNASIANKYLNDFKELLNI